MHRFSLKHLRLRTKLLASYILLITFCAALLSCVLYFSFRSQLRQKIRADLLDLVSVAALKVDAEAHAQLQTPSDQNTEAYRSIQADFRRIQNAGQSIIFVYSMRQNAQGQIVFIVDSDEDSAPIGAVYDDAGPFLSAHFSTLDEPVVETEFYTDQWGTWLSGYAPFYGKDGKREGVLAIDISAEAVAAQERQLILAALGGYLVIALITVGAGLFIARGIARPVSALTKLARQIDEEDFANAIMSINALAVGDLTAHFTVHAKSMDYASEDEIGSLASTFNTMLVRLQQMGQAFDGMTAHWREVVGQVAMQTNNLGLASKQLASAASQSGEATTQIAGTIQQVAMGITQQSQEVSRTSASVEQMNRAIHAVAKGAQKQAQAVQKTSTMAAQISSTMQQATGNAQSGAQGARQAADAAGSGAQIIEASIAGMQTIKTKVGLSAQKVREMGQRSEQINEIVETIDGIASQTNLLALNAAIEAARVEAQGEKTVESILQQHLLGAASLVAELLAAGRELHSKDLEELAHRAQVEQFSISDADGVIVAASNPRSLGFRFSEDPSHQSSVFRPLLDQREGMVVQPIRARDQDGKPFVFVGISRRDRTGIVQAGISGDVVYRLGGYSRGFAVVADEIRKLAEHAKSSTKEIALLIRAIRKTVGEAVEAMEDGVRDVESRSAQATEARKSLVTIIKTVEAVNRQVGEIAEAIEQMEVSSKELVSSMETVSAVVEENIATTKEMAANSNEMTQAVENIASVSEENSAAVEEVSASTEEVSAQVEQVYASAASLMEMAQNLQQVVAQFKLNLSTEDIPAVLEPVTPIA